MKDIDVMDVVCCFKQDSRSESKEKELIHIALSEEDAKKYCYKQVYTYLPTEDFSDYALKTYGNGYELIHYCDGKNHVYDRALSFTFDKHYGKLLIEQD